jgi:hypothetical protein
MPGDRTRESDYFSSEKAASALAARIVDYWSRLGYRGINAWVELTPVNGYRSYAIRSNIRNGLPPKAAKVDAEALAKLHAPAPDHLRMAEAEL